MFFKYFNLLMTMIHIVINKVFVIINIGIIHAFTFAVARGSFINPRPPGQWLKLLPRSTANVNALK